MLHDVCQKQLETVVPRPGELVLVLRGAYKMQRARLMQKDNKVIMIMMNAVVSCLYMFEFLRKLCFDRSSGWNLHYSNVRRYAGDVCVMHDVGDM